MAEKIKLGTNGNFGVKEGGTLAYNDENGVFKAIELASSRASGATYVAESGLIADAESGVPRIDWTNGVGELLLEPQSTNLIDYSEDFSLWTLVGDSVVDTGTTAFGKSVWRISESSGTNLGIFRNYIASGLVQTTISVLAKANTSNTLILRYGGSNSKNLDVDLSDGSITSSDVGVTSRVKDMGDGWYLVSSTITLTNTSVDVAIYTNSGAIDIIYAQAEELSYSTSYIRTSGSAVTRIADAVSGNSSLGQVINSSEGVLYFEGSFLTDEYSSFTGIYLRDSASLNDSVQIRTNIGSPNSLQFYMFDGGAEQVGITYIASSITQNFKIAFKYELNNVKVYFNGSEIASDTNATMPSGMNRLTFSNNGFRTRELKVYDTALTDAQLQTLTTL